MDYSRGTRTLTRSGARLRSSGAAGSSAPAGPVMSKGLDVGPPWTRFQTTRHYGLPRPAGGPQQLGIVLNARARAPGPAWGRASAKMLTIRCVWTGEQWMRHAQEQRQRAILLPAGLRPAVGLAQLCGPHYRWSLPARAPQTHQFSSKRTQQSFGINHIARKRTQNEAKEPKYRLGDQ